MKRIISLVCATALMVFTACDDVPAPYTINSNGGNTNSTTLLSETFASSLGKFTNVTTEGGVSWVNSYSCATATGYDSSTKTTTDGTAYLVSSTVDLTDVDSAYVTYEYILRYVRNQEYQKLVIAYDSAYSTNNITNAGWEDLITKHTEGSDYTTFYTASVNIPEKYLGKKIRLALYFKCETSSSTWEVKNFKVAKGAAENNDTPDEPTGDNTLPYTSSSLSDFTAITITGSAWSGGSSYAKATGYNSNDQSTTATEAWYVSPAINTTVANDSAAYIDFDYVIRYLQSGSDIKALHKVLISKDYSGDVTTATWTDLNFNAQESSTYDWTFYAAESMEIPSEFMNQEQVYIAFRFECPSSNSTTWELKNLNIHQGKSNNGGGDTPIVNPTGDNLLGNGDFETWSGSTPVNWKSTTTASSATLSQSNDAHGGNYAVLVEGTSSANKRLAYKEITLKAGTYTLSFYTKAATSTGGSVRPGYVPVTDGKVGQYAYGDYTNNLTADTWTEVSHSFTLSVQTTVNIVIMNPKNPGADILIDDVELTTSDGGLVDGGNTGGDDDSGDVTGSYSINFTSSTTGWTTNDISLGEMSYVWKQDATFGLKASAYMNNSNHAAESWYISPKLTIAAGATLSLNHALNFLSGNNRADFVSVIAITASGSKEELSLSQWPDGASWTYIDSEASLAKYAGQTIQIGFHYKSTADCAPTWEIKTLTIK